MQLVFIVLIANYLHNSMTIVGHNYRNTDFSHEQTVAFSISVFIFIATASSIHLTRSRQKPGIFLKMHVAHSSVLHHKQQQFLNSSLSQEIVKFTLFWKSIFQMFISLSDFVFTT